jgi:hypothetical protein
VILGCNRFQLETALEEETPMTAKTLDEAARTPARHWNIDGLPEMEVGSFLLLWGGIMAATELWPAVVPRALSAWGGIVFAIALMLVDQIALPRLKARATYPRVGYVRRRLVPARRVIALVLGFVVAVAAVAWVRFARHRGLETHDLPQALAVVLAVALVLSARRLGLARFHAYALVALVSGFALPAGVSSDLRIGLLQLAVGGAFLAGGAHAYRRLMDVPRAGEEEQ